MRNELEGYFKQLCLLFGSAALTVLMLKIVVLLYPAMSFEGISMRAPLLVLLQEESQLHALLSVLQGYGLPTVKSLASPPKEIRKILENVPYNLAIFLYTPGRYLLENLDQLEEKAAEINLSTSSTPLLIVIVAVGGIPVKYFDKMSGSIYIQGENLVDDDLIRNLPEIERPFIMHWLQNGSQQLLRKNGEPLDVFRTAAAFLVDALWASGYGEEEMKGYEAALVEELEKLEETWDMSGSPEDYADAFRAALFEAADWLPSPIFDRRAVEGLAVEELKLHMFFDRDRYYLPPALFEALCEPLAGNGGMTQIKIMLAEAGLLSLEKGGSGRNYFTPKVEIRTAVGYRERLRMIQLTRNKLDCPGELSFLEIMEARGGGFHD